MIGQKVAYTEQRHTLHNRTETIHTKRHSVCWCRKDTYKEQRQTLYYRAEKIRGHKYATKKRILTQNKPLSRIAQTACIYYMQKCPDLYDRVRFN